MFAGIHLERRDNHRIERVVSDRAKLAYELPELTEVAPLEPS